jgi:hypothetical protein
VIGVAVFPERVWRPRPLPPPPPPCCYDDDRDYGYYGSAAEAKRSAEPPAPASRPAPSDALAEGESRGSLGGKGKVAAEAGSDTYAFRRRERPGLGTEFGEAVSSRIHEVGFVRANPRSPAVIIGVRYNDHDGLLAMGVNVDGMYPWPGDVELRRTADPFPSSPRRYAAPPAGWRRY